VTVVIPSRALARSATHKTFSRNQTVGKDLDCKGAPIPRLVGDREAKTGGLKLLLTISLNDVTLVREESNTLWLPQNG